MHIESSKLDRLAILSRLALSADERFALGADIERVLGMVSALARVDVAGVTPMAHPDDASLRLRPDQVTEPDQQAALEAIAPEMRGGLYLVPKVLE